MVSFSGAHGADVAYSEFGIADSEVPYGTFANALTILDAFFILLLDIPWCPQTIMPVKH